MAFQYHYHNMSDASFMAHTRASLTVYDVPHELADLIRFLDQAVAAGMVFG